jgi:hypothetical protein
MSFAQVFGLLEQVETMVGQFDDNGNLDLAVAMKRVADAVQGMRMELDKEFDAHIEAMAARHEAMQSAQHELVTASWGHD